MSDISAEDSLPLQSLDFASRSFGPLPDVDEEGADLDRLVDAIQAMFWRIEEPVQSAWVEHISALFALFVLTRPRRYVELGVHRGTSILAACQAARFAELDCQCVGVDAWIGERHAGVSDDTVFNAFCERLAKYNTFSGYLRMDFSYAVGKFDQNSIDVLHIDGCHTAETVRRDFDEWVSKLSRRGLILFHDTNEFKSDFGVWRFWRSVKDSYPSVEFGHGHGLGILIVGDECPLHPRKSEIAKMLLAPERYELLQAVVGGVGSLSWASAAASKRPTDAELASVNRELDLAKRDRAELTKERDILRRDLDTAKGLATGRDQATEALRETARTHKLAAERMQRTIEKQKKALDAAKERLARLQAKKTRLSTERADWLRLARRLAHDTRDKKTRESLEKIMRKAKGPEQTRDEPVQQGS